MTIKAQFATIKENWLVIILGLTVLVFLSSGNAIMNSGVGFVKSVKSPLGIGYNGISNSDGIRYTEVGNDFAPEVKDRKIIKSSSLSTEIKRGEFSDAETQLKNIVTSSGAYLLNEKVSKDEEGWKAYRYGSYLLKVDATKYNSVVAQLKKIGGVQNFNENMADITKRYNNLNIELDIEKERLARYLNMYNNAREISDKIKLNDKIFNQERKIKYIEDSLENIDNRIDYSTINFYMTEERSEWADITFVKLSDLIRSFIYNFNTLLGFIFGVIPWAISFLIGLFLWKKYKRF